MALKNKTNNIIIEDAKLKTDTRAPNGMPFFWVENVRITADNLTLNGEDVINLIKNLQKRIDNLETELKVQKLNHLNS